MASPFSGKAGRSAAMWQAGYLTDLNNRGDMLYDRGLTNSVDALRGGLDNSLVALGRGFDTASTALTGGYRDAKGYLEQARNSYDPLVSGMRAGFDAYGDAVGANGSDGNARARANFQAGPGYQWQVDQATDGAARKAAALGLAGSGNTLDAITRLSSNLANQEYGSYVSRLAPYLSGYQNAVAGQAGTLAALGQLAVNGGTAMADLAANRGAREAGAYDAFGRGAAGLYSDDASNRVNLLANIGNQISQAGQGGMMAGQNAAANRLNFGMSLAQMAAQLAGSAMGGGGGGGAGGGGGGDVFAKAANAGRAFMFGG